MAKTSLADKSTEQLQSNLAAVKKIHLTTTSIMAVIVLAWIIGGYWRQNTPVFISTVAMAVALSVAQSASRNGMVQELKKRGVS